MKKKTIFIIVGVSVIIIVGLFVATKILTSQMSRVMEHELNTFLQSQNTQDIQLEYRPFVCEGSTTIVCKTTQLAINKHFGAQDTESLDTQSTLSVVGFSDLVVSFGGSKTHANIEVESDIAVLGRQFHAKCVSTINFIDSMLDTNITCNAQAGDMQSVADTHLAFIHPNFQSSTLHEIIKMFKDTQQRNIVLQDLEVMPISDHISLKSPSLKQSLSAFYGASEEDMQFYSVMFALIESSYQQAQNSQTKELDNALANMARIIGDVCIDDRIQEIWYDMYAKTPQISFKWKDIFQMSPIDIQTHFSLDFGKR
ncbi:hypothetical protein [Helicobacter equorum]|uniref:hypothetical protein n=1 Tax=Helicobacter equorum TaxID=361872 RepID=UPI000CF032D6|nr:hypothetical protein [Helicobacter equorum]